MVETIIFDDKCFWWDENADYNSSYIVAQIEWLSDNFTHRGYLYLNEVYEVFGIEWNPKRDNLCWIYGTDDFVIEVEHSRHMTNTFEITIHH